jgi:hypothetical protein
LGGLNGLAAGRLAVTAQPDPTETGQHSQFDENHSPERFVAAWFPPCVHPIILDLEAGGLVDPYYRTSGGRCKHDLR